METVLMYIFLAVAGLFMLLYISAKKEADEWLDEYSELYAKMEIENENKVFSPQSRLLLLSSYLDNLPLEERARRENVCSEIDNLLGIKETTITYKCGDNH